MKCLAYCTIVGLMLISAPDVLDAQDTEWNRYTLEKIGGVHVSVAGNQTCGGAAL